VHKNTAKDYLIGGGLVLAGLMGPEEVEGAVTLLGRWLPSIMTATTAACADGDCANEVAAAEEAGLDVFGRASETIDALPEEIAETFENGKYTVRVLKEKLTVYRAEGYTFGRWYGTIKPDSAANAERLYNVTTYGNDLLQVSTYEILPGTTIYEGPVAGGQGWQIFVDDPLSSVRLTKTEFLPQFGF
jgi:hypothetical protein